MAAFFFGFTPWKHAFVRKYFSEKIVFINPVFQENYFRLAKKKGLSEASGIYIWGRKHFPLVEKWAKQHNVPLYRVEDGFIRSVGLGSDLTQPYSLVVDSRGIYFDPTQESDLEHLLNTHHFSEEELHRAAKLRAYLAAHKISKYNHYDDLKLKLPYGQKIVLVPGQVEDDASIIYGANGMRNIDLLEAARANAPESYILFKPHPDVLAGNRKGDVPSKEALRFCDRIVTKASIDSVLSVCDEVHTMTSLVGFEAMMRGIAVYTYGLPFYAGWGLSHDAQRCDRRTRKLHVDELTAAALLLYPIYLDPVSKRVCTVEETLRGLQKERERIKYSVRCRIKQKSRNFLSRKAQLLLRLFH